MSRRGLPVVSRFPTRSGRGNTPTVRDPDERFDGKAVIDMVDELPGEDWNLEHELRQMGISTTSGVYANRRRE